MQMQADRRIVRRAIVGGVLLALVAGVGCGTDEDEVRRRVELAPAAHMPEGTSEIDVDHLSVQAAGLEPLAEGQYVVWADWRASTHGPESLGTVSADGELTVETPRDDDGRIPHEVVVTEEVGGEPFDSPSEAVRLRGAVDEELDFPGDFAEAVEESGGTARLRGQRVTVETSGLPAAPPGMHYETWVLWLADGPDGDGHGHQNEAHAVVRQPHGDGDDHDDQQDDGTDDHDDEETEADDHAQFHNPATGAHHDVDRRAHVGRLEADGHLEEVSDELIAAGDAVVISLESERGTEVRSPITVLAGAVAFPETSDDGHGHLH